MTHPIDAHVGQTLKLMRKMRGISQTEVARSMGVSFQQIQKYESGANRVSASRLWEYAKFIGTSPASLFPESDAEVSPSLTSEEVDLIEGYRAALPPVRHAILSVAKASMEETHHAI